MSNKRHKRNSVKEEFYVYKPGVAVPREVTHLLVPLSVKVLPWKAFRYLEHLKEVVISEGLREIEQWAFDGCTALNRIKFPSTLVRIGIYAFQYCSSLTTLYFPMGLIEIGNCAFRDCSSLTRISLSSTITAICDFAFHGCTSLEVVTLINGIRIIGFAAFSQCTLESIVVPATLTRIGINAFGFCQSLRRVKLCGGIQLIEKNAFAGCLLLEHVRLTSKCLVVTKTRDNFNFSFAIDRTIVSDSHLDRVVITSECFYSMSSTELSTLKIAVTEILDTRLSLSDGWDDKYEQLQALLAPHERRHKEEVAGLLKLGVQEAEMCHSGEIGPGIGEERPLTCKVDVIVENVVAFL